MTRGPAESILNLRIGPMQRHGKHRGENRGGNHRGEGGSQVTGGCKARAGCHAAGVAPHALPRSTSGEMRTSQPNVVVVGSEAAPTATRWAHG
jgi:hypothetical protein